MSNELWIKIGLIGADPQMGTLQGRVDLDESFSEQVSLDEEENTVESLIDSCIHLNVPFKLFDPIIYRLGRDEHTGQLGIELSLLPQTPPFPVATNYFTVNPASMAWWAPLADTSEWAQAVARTTTGFDLAGGGELDIDIPELPRGPRS